jgi:hypothetical protein
MKDIKGYEKLYAITSCGKVWSYKRKKFLSHRLDKDGYPRVTLHKDGKLKTFFIHRLVAMAYIPNPNNLPEVNHKDEIKTHDWVNNLEWCDKKYNANYGTRNKRISDSAAASDSAKKRKKIYCIELGQTFRSAYDAEKTLGVNQATISKCCNGKRDSAGKHPVTGEKLHWRFVEECDD